jgi:hypothetical protein
MNDEHNIIQTENWRRYAAWDLVRQAVIDLRRGGDITGVTTEKMKRLFPEIQTGYETLRAALDKDAGK